MIELFMMFAAFFVANHLLVEFMVEHKIQKMIKENELDLAKITKTGSKT